MRWLGYSDERESIATNLSPNVHLTALALDLDLPIRVGTQTTACRAASNQRLGNRARRHGAIDREISCAGNNLKRRLLCPYLKNSSWSGMRFDNGGRSDDPVRCADFGQGNW